MIYLNNNLVFLSGDDLNVERQTGGLLGLRTKEPMHQGKLVAFSQLMAHLPFKVFARCVAAHQGDLKVQDFACWMRLPCVRCHHHRLVDIVKKRLHLPHSLYEIL